MIKSETISTVGQIPIILIVLGYVNLHSFYISFGINVYNYIDSLELIMSFAPVLYEVGFAAMSAITGLLIGFVLRKRGSQGEITEDTKRIKFLDKEFRESAHWTEYCYELFKSITGPGKIYFMIISVVSYFFFIYFFAPEKLRDYPESVFAIIYVFALAGVLITWFFVEFHFNWKDINYSFVFTWLISLTLFVYVICLNKVRAKNIMLGAPKFEASFITDNGTFKADTTTCYIGSTRGFYFLYKRDSSNVIVIPNSTIKSVTLTERRKGI